MNGAWLTNAKNIREEVIIQLVEVMWYVRGSTRGPILYGDNNSLYLFDQEGGKLHSLIHKTYLEHKIIERIDMSKLDKAFRGIVGFRTRLSPWQETRILASLSPEEWAGLDTLARDCPHSRRWLMRVRAK